MEAVSQLVGISIANGKNDVLALSFFLEFYSLLAKLMFADINVYILFY